MDDAAAGFLLPESPELLEPPFDEDDFEPEADSDPDDVDEDESEEELDESLDFDEDGTLAESLARLSVR